MRPKKKVLWADRLPRPTITVTLPRPAHFAIFPSSLLAVFLYTDFCPDKLYYKPVLAVVNIGQT